MFFLVFIYSWTFLRPLHSWLSPPLPTPTWSPALSHPCQGKQTRADVMGALWGASPGPGAWPLAPACFPLPPPPWPATQEGEQGGGTALTKAWESLEGACGWRCPPPRGGSPARFRRAGSTGRAGGPAGLRFPPVPSAGQVRAWGNKGKCEASLCRCLGDRRVAFVSVLEMAEGQGGRIGAAFLRKNRCPMGKVTWCPQEPQHPINCLFCLPAVASKEDRDGGQGAARIPEGDLWALAGSCVEKGQPYSVFSVTRAYSLLILFQSDPRLGVTVL